jgi:hypothetical protein
LLRQTILALFLLAYLVQLSVDEELLDGLADEGFLEGEVDAEAGVR